MKLTIEKKNIDPVRSWLVLVYAIAILLFLFYLDWELMTLICLFIFIMLVIGKAEQKIKSKKRKDWKMKKIEKCHYCGKEGETGSLGTILYIHNQSEGGRVPTCRDCHIDLAKKGHVICPARYGHHLGTTCNICGMVD